MENECTSHNFIVLTILAPKIIKVGHQQIIATSESDWVSTF